MPAYSRPDTLARALESLLSQTYEDFALVINDDGPSARTAAILETYAGRDPRLSIEANSTRLGMVGNWRRVFERGRRLYPKAEYFAWVSDHDLWHARWLRELVSVLDACPDVVLAYPEGFRMVRDGARMEKKGFDTFGLTKPEERMRKAARQMLAGDMIYGLARVEALEAAGVFRLVMTPDRQVLLALSLLGQFRQVHEVLWYREVLRTFDLQRQRAVFFPDGAPFYVYLPSHLQHCAVLLWDFGVRAKGRPTIGRLVGIRGATIQLWCSFVRDLTRPKSPWRLRVANYALGRWLLSRLKPSTGPSPGARV